MLYDLPGTGSVNLEDPFSDPPHPLEAEAWRSQSVLSDTSQTELRNLRDRVHKAVTQQELEVARARALFDRHLDVQNLLISRLAKLDSAITPVKKLPPELLSEIFSYCQESPICLPPTNDGGADPVMYFSLTFVCSSWRQVALGTQALWNSVSVSYSCGEVPPPPHTPESSDSSDESFDSPHSQPHKDYERRMSYKITTAAQKIISRGTQIIEIKINHPLYAAINTFPAETDPAINLILPFASQIKHMTLVCSRPFLLPFLTTPPSSFDMLESITLERTETHSHTEDYRTVQNITVFGNIPSLRQFTLRRSNQSFFQSFAPPPLGHHQWVQPPPCLPWAQLSHIYLPDTQLHIQTALSLLAQTLGVIHCQFSFRRPNSAPIGPTQSLVLPHLQSLKLSLAKSLEEFLRPLVLPSLCVLEFSRGYKMDCLSPEVAAECVALIARSRCALGSFRGSCSVLEPELSLPELHLSDSCANLLKEHYFLS